MKQDTLDGTVGSGTKLCQLVVGFNKKHSVIWMSCRVDDVSDTAKGNGWCGDISFVRNTDE